MKATAPLLLVVPAILFGGLVHTALRAEEREKSVEQWIEQLRSDDFDQRQAAAKKLENLGDAARGALELAVKDDDADVRASAVKLLAKLSRATLALHIFDSGGKPVSNGEGELSFGDNNGSNNNPNWHTLPLKLDADGKASVKIPLTGPMQIQVKLDGFLESGNGSSLDAHTGINPVVMAMDRGGKVAGVVTGEDGKPLKDATVTLVPNARFDAEIFEQQLEFLGQANGTAAINLKAETAEDGSWNFENVAEGVYTPVVRAAGQAPAMGAMLRLREGQTLSVPAIAMKARPEGKLEIALKKADGSPRAKHGMQVLISPIYSGPAKALMQTLVRNAAANPQQKESDENGCLTLDDLVPGKYKLVVSGDPDGDKGEGGIFIQSEVEIKSGETTKIEQKKQQKYGSIRGKILGENGKGVRDMRVILCEEETLLDSLDNVEQEMPFGRPQNEADTDNKGSYRFENLLPGKYAIVFRLNSDTDNSTASYIFGIEVESGKKTVAPEATLKGSAAGEAPVMLKGRVLLPSGAPAKQVQMQYFNSRQNTSFTSNEDGTFELLAMQPKAREGAEHTREFLFIFGMDCKPFVAEGPLRAGKDYRLEAQDYGSLRVSVTDEKGKPLAGVKVFPTGAANNGYGAMGLDGPQKQPQAAVTNIKGVARLTGLAVGKRGVKIVFPGYWLPPKDAQFEIAANAEKELALVLRPGVTIAGRVRIPDGASYADATAILDNARCEPVGANGEFSFFGVIPGECVVSASALGLVAKEQVKLSLPDDPEKLKSAKLDGVAVELVHVGGIAIDCGKENAGRTAQLIQFDAANPTHAVSEDVLSASGTVDAAGRAEFWNMVPGKYRLALAESDLFSSAMAASGTNERTLTALPASGPFDVKPLAARAALAALEAVKADVKTGTGRIAYRIRMDAQPAWGEGEGGFQISLQIQGDAAMAEGELSDPAQSYWQSYEAPVVFGAIPEKFKPRVPGSFEVVALPPGAYKIYATLDVYQPNDDEASAPRQEPKPKEIGSFTIKAGEKLDLGELKFEPLEKPAPGKPDPMLKNMLRPYDKEQEFEP